MFIVDRHMIGPLDGVCWFFPEGPQSDIYYRIGRVTVTIKLGQLTLC